MSFRSSGHPRRVMVIRSRNQNHPWKLRMPAAGHYREHVTGPLACQEVRETGRNVMVFFEPVYEA